MSEPERNDEITLIDYLLGRCDAAEAQQVAERLKIDAAFQALHDDLSHTFAALDMTIEPEPPAELAERTVARVRAARETDDLLARDLEVSTDLVVLSVGMRPRQPETSRFHDLLKASLGLDGFFLERHPELAPVETAVEGVLLAGTVQGPKDIVDTVAQASAAAAKAAVFLAYDKVKLDPAVAVVEEEKCRACGKCVEICQFQAPQFVELSPGNMAVRINASLCKGCGTCASWCPTGAITSRHFTDDQVHAMIDAFFTEKAEEAREEEEPAR